MNLSQAKIVRIEINVGQVIVGFGMPRVVLARIGETIRAFIELPCFDSMIPRLEKSLERPSLVFGGRALEPFAEQRLKHPPRHGTERVTT
jgi:hypothetical protein